MRTKCAWPAKVAVPQTDGSVSSCEVTLIDLSTSGAMIKAASSLAHLGSSINLTLSVLVDQAPMELYLNASVCHNNRAAYEDAYFIGLAFKSLTTQDKLVLRYLT
jgi:hypothetical protein